MRYFVTATFLMTLGMLIPMAPRAQAQDGDTEFRIAYVRLDYILEECSRIQDKVEDLQQEYQGARNVILQKYREYQTEIEQMKRTRAVAPPEERVRQEERIKQMDAELREMYSVREANLESKKRRMLEPEVDHLQRIVRKLGKDRSYDIIFDEADIAFGAKGFDISDDVLTMFEDLRPTDTAAWESENATSASAN